MGGSANPPVSSWRKPSLAAVGAAAEPLVLQEGCGQINQAQGAQQGQVQGLTRGHGIWFILLGVCMFLQLIFFPCSECRSMFPVSPVVDRRGPACALFRRRIMDLVCVVCF